MEKSLRTDICAPKNCGHLHCMLSYVGIGLVLEGSIVLYETVGVECVFQHIAGLQLKFKLTQFKLKRKKGVINVSSKRVLEYVNFFNVGMKLTEPHTEFRSQCFQCVVALLGCK